MDSIRNIAIVAHVDHGKTTLVDQMLRQTGSFREGQRVEERVMDSNPLERERGITIFSKNASVRWDAPGGGGVKINIVDTPGHSDFGGEVERILRMVNGVLLLVDAFEGPMPQTRFVTRKALELGLHPVIIINKMDRPNADPERVHDQVLELLMELEATNDQLDSPFLYASARDGWCSVDPAEPGSDLSPLFRAVVDSVPPPSGLPGAPFQMLVSTLDYSPYLGRMAIGRIENGVVRDGDTVAVWALDADAPEPGVRIPKLYIYEAVSRVEVEEARAGQIVAIAGIEAAEIGATLCDPESPARLEGIAVEPPTLSVDFRPNTSPFAGRSGRFVTSRQLRERLFREVHSNVALRVEETEDPDRFRVSGRGELHLSILMETMRREGYEFSVSRPHVITHRGEDGGIEEPYEEVVADVPEGMIGVVMSGLGERRGDMVDMEKGDGGMVRLRFSVPSRALTGYRSEFLTETRGEGTLHRQFERYGPWAGDLEVRTTGVLVSMTEGVATAYSLFNLQERGKMFVRPVEAVYNGMIVGESGADDAIILEPPREITLEYALEFIRDDELVEVTPDAIRLRKRMLTSHERKRDRRAVKAD